MGGAGVRGGVVGAMVTLEVGGGEDGVTGVRVEDTKQLQVAIKLPDVKYQVTNHAVYNLMVPIDPIECYYSRGITSGSNNDVFICLPSMEKISA